MLAGKRMIFHLLKAGNFGLHHFAEMNFSRRQFDHRVESELEGFDEEGDFGGIGGMAGFQDPLYIILNNFLFTEGSRWKPGDCLVDENTTFPVEYRVKWMRLWQDETGELFIG